MPGWRVLEQTATAIHLEVQTSQGNVAIMADWAWFPDVRRLVFDRAHVEGEGMGKLGRRGLNELKAALAEFGGQFDAHAVILQGASRTSGRFKGRMPTMIVIPCLSR